MDAVLEVIQQFTKIICVETALLTVKDQYFIGHIQSAFDSINTQTCKSGIIFNNFIPLPKVIVNGSCFVLILQTLKEFNNVPCMLANSGITQATAGTGIIICMDSGNYVCQFIQRNFDISQ